MSIFEVSAAINADPSTVWRILTDARALESGGLGVARIEGEIAPGARIALWSEAAPGRAFRLMVTTFEPERRMAWEGGMPLGLFRGRREFTLAPTPTATLFQMRETFSGLLEPLIAKSMPDLTPSFEKFASGLKALAEAAHE